MRAYGSAKAMCSDVMYEFLPKSVSQLAAAFIRGGYDIRLVGGCVRDILLHRPIHDIDFAINTEPQNVIQLLRDYGVSYRTPGLSHGTIMVLSDHGAVEITSLRCDVKTDGRHAEVQYTQDWEQDALRRDFTINGMFMCYDGSICDYVGGLHDLMQGCVRFIGSPEARITEDVLRILRFFRFHAHYARADFDPESLKACIRKSDSIALLSGERITYELMRLLEAPPARALACITMMHVQGLLTPILPPKNIHSYGRLLELEKDNVVIPVLLKILALINFQNIDLLCARLRFSRKDYAYLLAIMEFPYPLHCNEVDTTCLEDIVYQYGVDITYGGLIKNYILKKSEPIPWRMLVERLHFVTTYTLPAFPIRGSDLIGCVAEGPAMKRALSYLENWWRSQHFMPTKAMLLEKLNEYIAVFKNGEW